MTLKKHEKHAFGFLMKHLLAGTIGGFVFGAAFLLADINGFKTLIMSSPDWPLYMTMLFFGLFITFGSVGMAWGLMSLGQERE